MNKRQKQVQQSLLKNEAQVLKNIEKTYQDAIDDIDKSRAVVSILKNRSGKSGKIFKNVYFDNGTCTISCSDVEEFDDGLAWEDEANRIKEDTKLKMLRSIVNKQEINKQVETHNPPIEGNFVGRIGNYMSPNKDF